MLAFNFLPHYAVEWRMDAPWSSGVVPATFQTLHNKNTISPEDLLELLGGQASLHQDSVAIGNTILHHLLGEFERVFSGEERNGPEDSKNPSTMYKKPSNLLRKWSEYFSQNGIRRDTPGWYWGFCRKHYGNVVVDLFSRTLPLVKSARFMTVDLTRHVVQLTCEVSDPRRALLLETVAVEDSPARPVNS
ncbi:hypothetical protein F5141DRAFT_1270895 [Pisolithus sp. B1]|nr:hypothetical protein F5141DRAFT_1270895 [Pisolithus sp. B1]